MTSPLCQRWWYGRDRYRRTGETIRTAEYDVETAAEGEARAFVLAHHYSGSYAARRRFGLFRRGVLAGVAVFSVPVNDRAVTGVFNVGDARDCLELGRFVLHDEVPGNGETWFL